MSATATPVLARPAAWTLPDRGAVGMLCFIFAESAIFTIFVVAYLYYVGKSLSGPAPADVLEMPIVGTVCLLSSSLTIHAAARALRRRATGVFNLFWLATIALGAFFLYGTAREWARLIGHGLTISTNLFGTTYYSLVGLHAFHVCAGLVMLGIVALFGLAGRVDRSQANRVDVLSLYWHFVDAVWVVVFTVVYVLGR